LNIYEDYIDPISGEIVIKLDPGEGPADLENKKKKLEKKEQKYNSRGKIGVRGRIGGRVKGSPIQPGEASTGFFGRIKNKILSSIGKSSDDKPMPDIRDFLRGMIPRTHLLGVVASEALLDENAMSVVMFNIMIS
jgi:hypothetical protein